MSFPGTVQQSFIGPFENGWSLSVISGQGCYSNLSADPPEYEVAILDPRGKINYDHSSGDVCAYITPEQIDQLAERIKKIDTKNTGGST